MCTCYIHVYHAIGIEIGIGIVLAAAARAGVVVLQVDKIQSCVARRLAHSLASSAAHRVASRAEAVCMYVYVFTR